MRSRSNAALALLVAVAAAALIVVAALGGFSGPGSSAPPQAPQTAAASEFEGAALPPGAPAPDFTLTDQHGRAVSLSGANGQVTVLAFLYTHCGGPCFLIAQQIRGALDQLGRPARVLIVSADPAGDTAASVRRFLDETSLGGRVSYLTGTPAQLRSVWRAYSVTPADAGRAAFDRVATVTLLDGLGRRRVLYQQEQLTPEALAHDIGKLEGG